MTLLYRSNDCGTRITLNSLERLLSAQDIHFYLRKRATHDCFSISPYHGPVEDPFKGDRHGLGGLLVLRTRRGL